MARAESSSLHGVVASEVPLASVVGASILSMGGNAVDAAVATSLALAVAIPHLGGVGGDFFMLYRSPEGRVFFINGSGYAPRGLTIDEVVGRGLKGVPERGPLSITVPGFIGGLYESWRRLGSLEWSLLVEPARAIASQGFPMGQSLARAIRANRACLEADEGSRRTYLSLDPEPGSPVRFPGLAALLEGVSGDPLFFYRGEVASAIEEYLYSIGGVMDSEDLRGYRGFQDDPLRIEYKGWLVYEMPPNTQGITTLHTLMLLEDEAPEPDPLSAERFKRIVEAGKAAYRVRDAHVGDPRYMKVDPRRMTDKSYILSLAGEPGARAGGQPGGDTTFFAVADSEGGVVAGIQSLFHPFGSCVTEPRFQVTLNNRALGFTLEEGRPSTLRPGAYPLHTLSAIIMESDGRVVALGASGGHLRPQQHAIFVTNIVDYGMSVPDAINSPRMVWDPVEDRILYEEGVSQPPEGAVRAERIGVASAVEVEDRLKRGYTDKRAEGIPAPALRWSAGPSRRP